MYYNVDFGNEIHGKYIHLNDFNDSCCHFGQPLNGL